MTQAPAIVLNLDVDNEALACIKRFVGTFTNAARDPGSRGLHLRISAGHTEAGEPVLLIMLENERFGFTTHEIRELTRALEDIGKAVPQGARVWSNLIVTLRAAADQVERDGDLKPLTMTHSRAKH